MKRSMDTSGTHGMERQSTICQQSLAPARRGAFFFFTQRPQLAPRGLGWRIWYRVTDSDNATTPEGWSRDTITGTSLSTAACRVTEQAGAQSTLLALLLLLAETVVPRCGDNWVAFGPCFKEGGESKSLTYSAVITAVYEPSTKSQEVRNFPNIGRDSAGQLRMPTVTSCCFLSLFVSFTLYFDFTWHSKAQTNEMVPTCNGRLQEVSTKLKWGSAHG